MEAEAAQSQRRSAIRSRSGTIRKPFSDRTNTISLSQSKPKPKPCPPPESKPSPAATAAGDAPLPPPRPSSSSGYDENRNVFEIHTVCTHKQTADKGKDKEKIVAVPFCSYTADRVVNVGNKRKECEDLGSLEPHTVPLKKIHLDGEVERRELAAMQGKANQSQRISTLRSSKCSRSSTIKRPLSDCTNTIFQSPSQPQSSPATVVPTRPIPKPYIQPKPQPNPTASTTNSPDPFIPLPPSRSSSHSGGGNANGFEIHKVYTRRQTADKIKGNEKALPVPFNSYSADRIANAGKKRKEYEDMGLVEPHTVPLTKKQCLGHDASEQALEDYIQQQRAYFDEVRHI